MKKVRLLPERVAPFVRERGGVLSIAEQIYLVG